MPKIEKMNITRVNMNLPTDLVNRVKKYADNLGLPITQAYTVLLNQAFEQKDALESLVMLTKEIQNERKND